MGKSNFANLFTTSLNINKYAQALCKFNVKYNDECANLNKINIIYEYIQSIIHYLIRFYLKWAII